MFDKNRSFNFSGQPRRHLLTTGWSVFVSQKNLVSGDAVLFLRYIYLELRFFVVALIPTQEIFIMGDVDNLKENEPYITISTHLTSIEGLLYIFPKEKLRGIFLV